MPTVADFAGWMECERTRKKLKLTSEAFESYARQAIHDMFERHDTWKKLVEKFKGQTDKP